MDTQYIGARYVPIIYTNPNDNSANWQADTFEPLTIVIEDGDSYTSKEAVPPSIGKPSENPAYWVKTGDFNASLLALQNEVQSIEAEIGSEELTTIAQTLSGAVNELNKLVGFVTPEMFGAKGDGVNDDTQALSNALAAGNVGLKSGSTYLVRSRLNVTHSIFGNGATIKAASDFGGIDGSLGVIPTKVILFVYGDDIEIKDLTISGYDSVSRDLIGVYVGNPIIYALHGGETNTFNYSSHNLKMSKVNIYNTKTALLLADCWNSLFDTLTLKNSITGVDIAGQNVNNYFSNCYMENNATTNDTNVVYVRFSQYQPNINTLRSEGIIFTNTYLGWSYHALNINHGTCIYLTDCILDQIANSVLYADDLSDVNISNSYMYCHNCDNVIQLAATLTVNSNVGVISNCTIYTSSVTRLAHLFANNRGLTFIGCHLPSIPCYTEDDTTTMLSFVDCIVNSASITNMSQITGNVPYYGTIYNSATKTMLKETLSFSSDYGTFSGIAIKIGSYAFVNGTFTCTTSITENWRTYGRFNIGHTGLTGSISANDNFMVNIGDGSITRYATMNSNETAQFTFIIPIL